MWPILKKAGYSANMAAGLISAGGIGAVISPPLMGAAAFLIMQFLGVSFWDVVIMSLFPPSCTTSGPSSWLKWRRGSTNLYLLKRQARQHGRSCGLGTSPYFVIVLVVLLGLGRSPASSAIWAIITTVLTSFLSRDRQEWLVPVANHRGRCGGRQKHAPVAGLLAAAA